ARSADDTIAWLIRYAGTNLCVRLVLLQIHSATSVTLDRSFCSQLSIGGGQPNSTVYGGLGAVPRYPIIVGDPNDAHHPVAAPHRLSDDGISGALRDRRHPGDARSRSGMV